MQHPDLIYLIQREIQNDRIREARLERQKPQLIAVHPLRQLAGRALIAMGTRLSTSPRPAASRPAIGGVALAGRIGR